MKVYQVFFLLLLSIFLSNCSADYICLDPDDFGFPRIDISSRYNETELVGLEENQVAPWRTTGFKTNGRPIFIVVRNWDKTKPNTAEYTSAWSGWFGTSDDANSLSTIALRMPLCQFNGTMCPANSTYLPVSNPPCVFTQGIGLYGLIAKLGTDPNSSTLTKRSPEGVAFHLGENPNTYRTVNSDGVLELAGGIQFDYAVPNEDPAQLRLLYNQADFYFKILDSYYSDNSGQYKVLIKSGLSSDKTNIVEGLIDSVKEFLFGSKDDSGIIKTIYNRITLQSGYITAVKALLMLYVIFCAFGFLLGSIKITHTELIIRALKVIVVSLLISNKYSWNFFYNNLYFLFINGTDAVISMVTDSSTNLGKIPLIGIFLSQQVYSKLFSLLFVSLSGWLFIILFLCLAYFAIIVTIKAVVVYLSALIAISVIIICAPIFLCFWLFDFTRSFFENWLKQLISYAVQPIILFAGITFLSNTVTGEVYKTLGFPVCKQSIFVFNGIQQILGAFESRLGMPSVSSLFYFWFPSPRNVGKMASGQMQKILVPYDHYDSNGKFCYAYQCEDYRYPELPFLNPNDPSDLERIKDFQAGNFVNFYSLLIFAITIYLLHKFNTITVGISKILSNSSGSLTKLESSSSKAASNIEKGFNSALKKVYSPVLERVSRPFKSVGSAITRKAAEAYSKVLINRDNAKAKQVLDNNMFKSVKKNAEKQTGIKYENLNLEIESKYKAALKNIFQTQGAKNIDANLLKLSPDQIKNKLAELKYKKGFNSLTQSEKDNINLIIKSEETKLGFSFEEAQKNLNDIKNFQKAYVEAYNSMSARGIGYFGKNIAPLRVIQEIIDEKGKMDAEAEAKQFKKGERWYKMYDEVLSAATKGVLGGNFNYIDYNDNRLRTYSEQLTEEQHAQNAQRLNKQINKLNQEIQRDIFNPYYKSELILDDNSEDLENINELENQKIKLDVYDAMTAGEDPVLKGTKYMKERMTRKEFGASINKAYAIEQELLTKDDYLKDYNMYSEGYDSTSNSLIEKLKILKSSDEAKFREAENLLNDKEAFKEYLQKPDDHLGLKDEIYNHYINTEALQSLESRKALIQEETKKYIDELNNYRNLAGMEEYKPYKSTESKDIKGSFSKILKEI